MRSGVKAPVPNLRGKKVHWFSCGCCWARDDRDEQLARLAHAEVEDALAATPSPQPGSAE